MTGRYHTSPATIADGLRRIADDLDGLGDTPIPETAVSLNIQVTASRGSAPEPDRVAAVDRLMSTLTPDHQPRTNSASDLYGTPPVMTERYGIGVDVFTGIRSSEERRLREENDRLRAQLAKSEDDAS